MTILAGFFPGRFCLFAETEEFASPWSGDAEDPNNQLGGDFVECLIECLGDS